MACSSLPCLLALLIAAQAQAADAPRGPRDPYAGRKKVLVVGDLRTGNQVAHDAVSHAMAVIEQLGRESGAYVAFLRSDTDLVTKGEVWGKGDYAKGGPRQARGRNLDYFDAVVFYTNGETEMTAQQRADLLSFIHDDGKGFVAIHTGTISYPSWPDYAALIGARWDNHPWNVVEGRLRNERADFPVMQGVPAAFTLRDEHYQFHPPSLRGTADVLLSLDPASVDMTARGVHRGDGDFPLVWARTHGKGRVLVSSLGHTDESWDDANLRRIHLQGLKWVLGLTEGMPQPHAAPRVPAGVPLGSGPHKAVMLQEPTLPTHTLYRPADLAALGDQKLPVVVWGNGACVNMGNRFRYFLTEIASRGYLVIATGPEGPAEAEGNVQIPRPANARPRDPANDPPETTARQLNDAIDWALRENRRRGSPLRGRIDAQHIAAMGQSCGGAQAIVAGADRRVSTTVVWNSGTFATGPVAATGLPGAPATKASLRKLHGTVAYFSGDESDIAHPNAKDDFARINHMPVLWAWPKGVGHGGTYREPMGGEFSGVAIAWLDWQLKGSEAGRAWFLGAECRLCRDPRWTVQAKGF